MGALAGIVLRWLLDPRVLGVMAVVAVVGFGWWHYTSLRDDLADAKTELAAAQTAMQQATELAENNANQLAAAAAQHRATIALLEAAQAALNAATDAARAAEAHVRAAPEADDGPVAPLLEDLRTGRFGGQS